MMTFLYEYVLRTLLSGIEVNYFNCSFDLKMYKMVCVRSRARAYLCSVHVAFVAGLCGSCRNMATICYATEQLAREHWMQCIMNTSWQM